MIWAGTVGAKLLMVLSPPGVRNPGPEAPLRRISPPGVCNPRPEAPRRRISPPGVRNPGPEAPLRRISPPGVRNPRPEAPHRRISPPSVRNPRPEVPLRRISPPGGLIGFKGAKGSVQFPLDKPLPLDLIRCIAAFRAEENRAKAASRKKR